MSSSITVTAPAARKGDVGRLAPDLSSASIANSPSGAALCSSASSSASATSQRVDTLPALAVLAVPDGAGPASARATPTPPAVAVSAPTNAAELDLSALEGSFDEVAQAFVDLLPVEYDSDFDDDPNPASTAGPAAADAAADDPLLPADRPPVHVALPRSDEIYCGESRLNATHPQHAPQVAASTFTPANDPPWRMPAGPPPPPTTWRPPPGQPWMVWRGFRFTKCDSRFTRSGGQFVQRIMASRGLETWQLGPKGLFWLQQLWLKSQRRRIKALAEAARSRAGREPHAVNTEPVNNLDYYTAG